MIMSSRHVSNAFCRPARRPGVPASWMLTRDASNVVHGCRSTPADTQDQGLSPTPCPIHAIFFSDGSSCLETTYGWALNMALDLTRLHRPIRAIYILAPISAAPF